MVVRHPGGDENDGTSGDVETTTVAIGHRSRRAGVRNRPCRLQQRQRQRWFWATGTRQHRHRNRVAAIEICDGVADTPADHRDAPAVGRPGVNSETEPLRAGQLTDRQANSTGAGQLADSHAVSARAGQLTDSRAVSAGVLDSRTVHGRILDISAHHPDVGGDPEDRPPVRRASEQHI